jgi:hypothetical protein
LSSSPHHPNVTDQSPVGLKSKKKMLKYSPFNKQEEPNPSFSLVDILNSLTPTMNIIIHAVTQRVKGIKFW